jgi:hypothetical protein
MHLQLEIQVNYYIHLNHTINADISVCLKIQFFIKWKSTTCSSNSFHITLPQGMDSRSSTLYPFRGIDWATIDSILTISINTTKINQHSLDSTETHFCRTSLLSMPLSICALSQFYKILNLHTVMTGSGRNRGSQC